MYCHIRAGLGVLIFGLCLLMPPAARAQTEDPAVMERVTNLNKKALEAYNDLEFEDARKLLKQALDLCSSAGLDKHPIKARTHIHMGVVLIAAKQQELGVKQFRKALDIQPDIQVTKALASPEIIQAFEEASAGSPLQPPGGAGVVPGESEPGGPSPNAGGGPGGGHAAERTAPMPASSIEHVAVTRGRKGKPLPIVVTVSPELTGYTKMVLAYRPQGGDDFLPADMRRSGNRFMGEIPAEATNGNHVYYYIEAEAEDDTAVASNGSEQKPYFVALAAEGGRAGVGAGDVDEEEDEAPRFFLAVLGGSGIGLATGNGEVNADNKVNPGFAPSTAAQLVPEVGYYVSPHFRISVQLRYQLVTGTTPLNLTLLNKTGCGSDNVCTPASRAVAVLARGAWLFGSGTFRPYFSWALGGGEIRHVVKFGSLTPICGPRGGQVCVDTVVAGPVFAGPGGGVLISLTQRFGLIVELESLLGFPKWTYHFDFNAGVAARF
jgi:hypothetical protein